LSSVYGGSFVSTTETTESNCPL